MPPSLKLLAKALKEVPLAPALSILFGLVAAILVLAMPSWMFDRMIIASGLPSLVDAATPPLGGAAKAVVAIAVLWGVSAILWPVFALPGILMAPKPAKGKGHRIEPDFDPEVPATQFEALIRGPFTVQSETGQPAARQPNTGEHASDAVASRTIEPRKYRTRTRIPAPTEALDAGSTARGNSETRH